MSLFCLGFGKDVQYSFLDVICRQNKGFARRIFEGSDAALQLQVKKKKKSQYTFKVKRQSLLCERCAAVSSQGFYEEVSSPLLLDVDLRYPENTVGLLTKNHFSQLFNGSEIVVAGQMDLGHDNENFLVEVVAKGVRITMSWQGQTHLCFESVAWVACLCETVKISPQRTFLCRQTLHFHSDTSQVKEDNEYSCTPRYKPRRRHRYVHLVEALQI